jgi:two-component system, sensor histidine kinase and response regulator
VNISDLWTHPEERIRLSAMIEREGALENVEVEFCRPDGRTVWCVLSSQITYDPTGKIDHYEGVSVDITERKHAEEELNRARDAALEGVRIKSEFMPNMRHEIRTPLNGIIGMNELLLDSGLNSEQFEFAKTAAECGNLLMTIVNDILDFSKLIEGKVIFERIAFDLTAVLESTIESFAEKAHSKGLELILAIAVDVPASVAGDSHRLRQVLNNLIGNALKFTESGEVAISVSVQGLVHDRVTIRFAVRDTGIGVPQNAQAALFNAFSQADASTTRKYGGTGLGLTISNKLVAGMKGKIELESAVGEGSLFYFSAVFELPQVPSPEVSETVPLAGRSALVVDDNAANRVVLAEAMRSWGMDIGSAASGVEALDALRRRSLETPFDVILVDAQMPGMDGLTLARTIGLDPDLAKTPLIMMGAMKRSETVSMTGNNDSSHWLSKPIRPSHLYAALCAMLTSKSLPLQRSIPVVAQQPQSSAANPRDGNAPSPKRILVVDDNLVNRKVAQRQLERLGYLVDVVDGGKAALAVMTDAIYPVVLMDCEMPEMDGYETTAEIRRRDSGRRHTTIIAMTAHALEGARERCLAAGMDDYIAKPVTLESLAAVLEVAFSQRQVG